MSGDLAVVETLDESVEKARCLEVAMECLEHGPGFDASKEFADGYSLACQEIAAGIVGIPPK